MWTIRARLVLLLVAGLAAHAPAGDDAPGGAKKQDIRVLTEDEWFAKVKDIEKIDSISIKRSEVLEKVAARTIVSVRVKIRDIRATADGVAIEIIDTVPRKRPADTSHFARDPILLPASEREVIATWARWDRLVYKVKPRVTPDGALDYARLVTTAADLDRTSNPGVEYPEPDRPVAKTDTFRDWVDRYTRACTAEKWRPAWQLFAQASSVYFPMTAVVKDPTAEDPTARQGRGGSSHAFDILESTGVTDYGLLDVKGHPISWVWAEVEDPQVCELLRNGMRAEVHLHVHGLDNPADLEVRKGHFRVGVTFGRLR